jgi:glycosyltransferase involved in cell wall biosynthesis
VTAGAPFLTVVIPAYNAERLVEETLRRVVAHLQTKAYSWEVVVSDDGSTDRTAELVTLASQAEPRVRLVRSRHGGKGWAVRNGMLASKATWRFMCDADLSMPPEQIDRFVSEGADPDFDIGIGSREAPGARRFDEPARRHLYGRIFNRVVRVLAVRGLDDTQCGFKIFRGTAADYLFSTQRLEGFGFDVEVLFIARRAGLRLKEIAIDWYFGRDSKMTFGKGAAAFTEILRIRWNGIRGRYPRPTVALAASTTPPAAPAAALPAAPAATLPPAPAAALPAAPASVSPAMATTGTGSWVAATGPRVVVVIPTFNEAQNLPVVIDELSQQGIDRLGFVIVDDASPDGTGQVAEGIAAKYPGFFRVIHRTRKEGLGKAYAVGFHEAIKSGAEYVVEMDADLSHPPAEVPKMLSKASDADVVAGSRYIRGGAVDPGWSLGRRMLSRFGNLGIKLVVGLRVHDATSGFKVFRRTALELLDFARFRNAGYGFQAEVAHWCEYLGMRVIEHPYQFAERRSGKSKMSGRIVLEAVLTLVPLRFHRPPKRSA